MSNLTAIGLKDVYPGSRAKRLELEFDFNNYRAVNFIVNGDTPGSIASQLRSFASILECCDKQGFN